ncbi:MAG: hypothetical protein AAF975_04055 [Spirochaetota bacterium]
MNRYCYDFGGVSRWGHMGGWLMMGIIGVLLLAYILYRLILSGQNGGQRAKQLDSPQDLLQKRYVNGEILREEYLEKKATLRQK